MTTRTRTVPSYRFVRRPVWILGHLVAAGAVVAFVALGMWQLDRREQRALFDQRIEVRMAAPAEPFLDLVDRYGEDGEALDLRRTHVEGRFVVGEEIIVVAQSLGGRAGHDVLTPLVLGDRGIIVNRGWVPIDAQGPPVVGAEPPAEHALVTGVILDTEVRRGFGPIDPATGTLDRISRVDVARIQQQSELDLYSFWIQLEQQLPVQETGLPLPQTPPGIAPGPPHLSYALQWFVFSVVTIVGYPILLRRTARRSGA